MLQTFRRNYDRNYVLCDDFIEEVITIVMSEKLTDDEKKRELYKIVPLSTDLPTT